MKILKDAGINANDFEWEQDTDTYLQLFNWEDKDSFLTQFDRELKTYPISCLKNIIPVGGTADHASTEMQKYAKQALKQAYNNEKNLQLKHKIANALGMCSVNPPLHYFTIALQDPDLCDKQRNRVWKEIIDRWSRSQHKTIDVNNLRDALRAIYEKPFFSEEKSRNTAIFKSFFRQRVLNTHTTFQTFLFDFLCFLNALIKFYDPMKRTGQE